jgi:copper chaperone
MTIDLHLPDMSCQHCVRVVTETVRKTDPAATLTVDLQAHRVSIRSDKPAQEFSTALAQAGYPSP